MGDEDLDVPVGAGQPQIGVEGFHGPDPETHLAPGFVADHDGDLPGPPQRGLPARPGVQARQCQGEGFFTEGFQAPQRQRLDDRVPVQVDGGGGVEQAGQRAGDQRTERVGGLAGGVEHVLFAGVAAVAGQLRAG